MRIHYTLSHWIVCRFLCSLCFIHLHTRTHSWEFLFFAHTCGTHSFSVCKRKSFCTTGGQKNNLTVRHILWTSQMILTSFITISRNTSNDKCKCLLCTAVFSFSDCLSSIQVELGWHFFPLNWWFVWWLMFIRYSSNESEKNIWYE